MRKWIGLLGMVSLVFLTAAGPALAKGGAGGSGGGVGAGVGAAGGDGHSKAPAHSNAGGAVRGLERGESVGKGHKFGVEKAEQKIMLKDNPRNPNTQVPEETGQK